MHRSQFNIRHLSFVTRHSLSLLIILFLTGCVHQEKQLIEPAHLRPAKEEIVSAPIPLFETGDKTGDAPISRFAATPSPVKFSPLPVTASLAEPSPLTGPPVDVNFNGLSLPAFINEVYGNLLNLSFEIDPALQKKKDLVTLRTADPQLPSELDALSRQVLENYGVAVVRQGDLLRFTPAKGVSGEPPLMFSGRALPEVPVSHRPVFQLVPLTVVRNVHVKGWLTQAFKGQHLEIFEDAERNAVLLKGSPALVKEAMAAIHILDQPYMRGRRSVRIEPFYLGADELAKLLVDVLNTEGYSASIRPSMGSIIVLPVRAINALLVFAAQAEILDHVKQWAENLDQPGRQSQEKKFFFYTVRNTSAVELGKVLNAVLSGMKIPFQEKGLQKKERASPGGVSSRLIVDEFRNNLIFQGDVKEWQQVLALVKNMDQPARQVLIEVTIAEVTLSEEYEMGVEWLINGVNLDGWDGIAQTLGGLGVGGRGFSWTLNSAGQTRAVLNAFAYDNRVKILSTPRIMVKSGVQATIDVGTDVPIVISRQTSSQLSTDGDTGILQSIAYRKTGVLLSVKPVVYSGNHVDLEISQEVSEVSSQKQSEVQSPSILTRRIETSLSLRDGGSVLLGGLISTNIKSDTIGVPLLMDIPWMGHFFRVDSDTERRTELMMLIVPYVIDSHEDARAVTKAMKDQMSIYEIEAGEKRMMNDE